MCLVLLSGSMLGHTYVKEAAGDSGQEGTPESIEIGSEDEAPYFGVGFYKRRKKNGVVSFTVIWLVQTPAIVSLQKMQRQKVTLQTSRLPPLKVKHTQWKLMARCQSVKNSYLTAKLKRKHG